VLFHWPKRWNMIRSENWRSSLLDNSQRNYV